MLPQQQKQTQNADWRSTLSVQERQLYTAKLMQALAIISNAHSPEKIKALALQYENTTYTSSPSKDMYKLAMSNKLRQLCGFITKNHPTNPQALQAAAQIYEWVQQMTSVNTTTTVNTIAQTPPQIQKQVQMPTQATQAQVNTSAVVHQQQQQQQQRPQQQQSQPGQTPATTNLAEMKMSPQSVSEEEKKKVNEIMTRLAPYFTTADKLIPIYQQVQNFKPEVIASVKKFKLMLATHFEGASKGQYLLNAETALKLYQESTRFIQHMLNHIRAASAGTPALKQQLMQLQSQIAQSKEGSIPASSATSTTSTSVANAQASSPPSTQLSLAKSPPSLNFALPQKPQPTNQKSIPNSSTSPPQQQVQLKGPSIGASANPMVPTTSSVAKPQLSGQQSTQIKPISSLRGGKPPPSSKTPNKPPQMYFLEHIQYLAMSNQDRPEWYSNILHACFDPIRERRSGRDISSWGISVPFQSECKRRRLWYNYEATEYDSSSEDNDSETMGSDLEYNDKETIRGDDRVMDGSERNFSKDELDVLNSFLTTV